MKKSNASIKTPTKRTQIQSPVRQPSRRDRKQSIDYKQLHEDGVYEEKKRHIVKYPPLSSGPSELRLEAQKQIVQNKKTPERNAIPRPVATGGYVPLRTITTNESENTKLKSI